uniref:PCNA-interacting partner n=1 Tax=Hucho hucho TaxID=62062 RepID=A0A4W5LYR9_9TELE
LVRTFRRECHLVFESERTTIHGADGMLMVLQLAIAEVNKQESGEFSVALSDVLMTSFLKRTNTMDLIDIHSMYKQLKVDPEPLSSVSEGFPVPGPTPSSKSKPCSTQVNRYVVRRVFCSYLDQLVNSKNDMALAHTLDTPSRSLGRIAFTDLKREARSKNMSLFLAVTSFVRAVQLGGQGYAPAVSDPLRKHEILGDNPNPSSAGVGLVTNREALLKGRASGDVVYAAADETARDLKERIAQIHLSHRLQSASGTGISPARPRYHAINHATAYGGRETEGPDSVFACTYQDDLELPLNRVLDFPSTIQGPTCVHPAPKRTLPTVESTSAGRKEAQRGGTTRGVAAALGPRSGNDAPSSRAGRGGLKTNIQTEGSSKACKRKLVDCSEHCGSENQPPLKKPPTSVTSTKMSGKNGGAKGPSKKKLIAGQGKLTSFFRL